DRPQGPDREAGSGRGRTHPHETTRSGAAAEARAAGPVGFGTGLPRPRRGRPARWHGDGGAHLAAPLGPPRRFAFFAPFFGGKRAYPAAGHGPRPQGVRRAERHRRTDAGYADRDAAGRAGDRAFRWTYRLRRAVPPLWA